MLVFLLERSNDVCVVAQISKYMMSILFTQTETQTHKLTLTSQLHTRRHGNTCVVMVTTAVVISPQIHLVVALGTVT